MNKKIITIIILIIASIALIVVSSLNLNSTVKYDFYSNLTISNQQNYNLKIGEVNIDNSGFLPVKKYLKNLIGCINNSTYHIEYTQSLNDPNVIFGDANGPYVELNPSQNKTLSIITYLPSLVKFDSLGNPVVENLTQRTLRIYELNKSQDIYDSQFCIDASPNQAIQTISIN